MSPEVRRFNQTTFQFPKLGNRKELSLATKDGSLVMLESTFLRNANQMTPKHEKPRSVTPYLALINGPNHCLWKRSRRAEHCAEATKVIFRELQIHYSTKLEFDDRIINEWKNVFSQLLNKRSVISQFNDNPESYDKAADLGVTTSKNLDADVRSFVEEMVKLKSESQLYSRCNGETRQCHQPQLLSLLAKLLKSILADLTSPQHRFPQ